MQGVSDFDTHAGERTYAELLLQYMLLLTLLDEPVAQIEPHLRAVKTALVRHPDPHLLAVYHLRRAALLSIQAQYEAAYQAALTAYDYYCLVETAEGMALSLYQAGRYRLTVSRNREAGKLLNQALVIAQGYDLVGHRGLCLNALAWVSLNRGAIPAALDHLEQSLTLSRQQGDRLQEALATYSLAAAWHFYYDCARVQEYAEAACQLYVSLGLPASQDRPRLYLAEVHRLQGRIGEAEAMLRQLLAGAETTSDKWLEGWVAQILGRLALERGDLASAEQWLAQAAACRQISGEVANQVSDLAWLGRLLLAQKRQQEALALTTTAINQLEKLRGEAFVWESQDIFLAHAEALAATGGSPKPFIERAYQTMMALIDPIVDPHIRQQFLQAPLNRQITAVYHNRLIFCQ